MWKSIGKWLLSAVIEDVFEELMKRKMAEQRQAVVPARPAPPPASESGN